jgi:O-antigen ligase
MTTPLPRLTTWLIMLVILMQPFASGLRGISVVGGQGLILFSDVLLAAVLVGNVHRIRDRRLQGALALAAACIVYTLTIPGFPLAGLIGGIRKSFLILVALAVGTMINPNRRRDVNLTIIITGLVVALYAIKQHFFFDTFDGNLLAAQSSDKYTNMFNGEQRVFSLLSSGFHVGLLCLVLVAYSLFTKTLGRYPAVILFAVAMVAMYFTFTRTCLIIALVMVAYRICRALRVPVVIAASTVVVLYALFVIVAPDQVPNPFTAVSDDTRFTGRSVSYTAAAESWDAAPLRLVTGFGIGSAGSAQGELFNGPAHIEPHNIFLKYVFEMGVVPGVLFLFLFGSMITSAIRSARRIGERDFVAMLVFAVVLSGLSITVVEAWPANVYFFLIIGMYLARQPATAENQDQADVDDQVADMLAAQASRRDRVSL